MLARGWELLQTSWSYQGRQYFETSTLHGVRYIAEKGRPGYERLLWFVSTTAGLIAALVIIDSLWDKFMTSPTITGLDTDYHSWDVPFPALTLCQQDPANGTLVEELIAKTWPDADEAKTEHYRAFLNALTNISQASLPMLRPFLQDDGLPQTGLRELAHGLLNHCHAFTRCAYKESLDEIEGEASCCPLLFPIWTENGFCFSFNLNYTMSDWPWDMNRPPFQEQFIEETDSRWSLTFETDDPVNNTIAVFITSSLDMPGADISPQHIWNRRVSKLMFVPKMTYTADGARELSIQQRGCVFPDEIRLQVAPLYTFSSCTRQCRMQMLIKACGCLPFYYELLPKQRYCELRELRCVIDQLESVSKKKLRCPCQLGCENTVYDMEKPHEAGGESSGGEGSGVEVGFLSWPLTRYKREVLFGSVDLLVSIGTIAGLFLGFSLLSGVEIVYYFTLRALCMLKTERRELEELAHEYNRKSRPEIDLSLRPTFMQGAKAADGEGGGRGTRRAEAAAPPLWRINHKRAATDSSSSGGNKIFEPVSIYPYLH